MSKGAEYHMCLLVEVWTFAEDKKLGVQKHLTVVELDNLGNE